jgi:hypothetical protein
MAVSLESPRFSLRSASFGDIEAALATVGHAVLDDVWNPLFLAEAREAALRAFAAPAQQDVGYVAFTELFPGPIKDAHDRLFRELERSGLPALLKHLLAGDVVVDHNNIFVRRADVAPPIRFTGLHRDGQLQKLARSGINSTGEFTTWTPIVDCTSDDLPRLLLLHRDEQFNLSMFEGTDRVDGAFHPIQLRPRDMAAEAARGEEIAAATERQFDRLFEQHRCYAPHVPVGSVVIFVHSVTHGSYIRRSMTHTRLSFDFRTVGVYAVEAETPPNRGMAFRCETYPAMEQFTVRQKAGVLAQATRRWAERTAQRRRRQSQLAARTEKRP